MALEREPKPDDGDTRSRARYPSPDTIADIAEALEVEPEEFPEFRLAMARRALDERAPGNTLDGALEALEVFKRGSVAHVTHFMGDEPDVDIVLALEHDAELDRQQLVEWVRILIERAAPNTDVEAALAEAATPSEKTASTRYRAFLRRAAQHKLEHPEGPAETPDEEDAQEKGQ